MQILSAEQIRKWDAFTMEQQHISSMELMDKAVSKCLEWLESNGYLQHSFVIYCGLGNNGGDGLVLARSLAARHCPVKACILDAGNKPTAEFEANLVKLRQTAVEIITISAGDQLNPVPPGTIVIDALFGSGLNRRLDDTTTALIKHINECGNEIISIDIPSGMYADKSSRENTVIRARHTLSFQSYKLAFLLPENEGSFGKIHILDIGLSPAFLHDIRADFQLLDKAFIKTIYKARTSFAHKGTYGHALLVAGSYGKVGAAVLASKACLRSGVGLLTVVVPSCGYEILQIAVPEAMAMPDICEDFITRTSMRMDLTRYNVIGIGPGLGTENATVEGMDQVLSTCTLPMVIDADALNILAANNGLLQRLVPFSILSPHPKEFERLFGKTPDDFERVQLARKKASELQVIIILKGHRTLIAMPDGKAFFNSTGNAGMATGGSGDVLTGILTGLLAQNYTPEQAALFGVYLHGLAGDYAAQQKTQEAMIASDIVDCLGQAFGDFSFHKA